MNPYKILGVKPNASQDEIKEAYRALSETYSLETFKDSPEEPLAEDKLSELNEAYSILINNVQYKDIRKLIENEQFLSAETELNLISDKTSPEWNYLKGFVMLKKGWFQAGITHLKTAAELNPNNQEYRDTLKLLNRKMNQMRAYYAKMSQSQNSSNNNMCGGGGQSGGNMCGSSPQGGGGSGIDPNLLNMFMNMGNQGGAVPGGGANPLAGATGNNTAPNSMPQGNPMQNLLMQSLLGGGGGGMNMCGPATGGGMC